MEYLVDCLCRFVHIGKEPVSLLVTDIDDLAHMILVSHDAASALALLLKEDQLADIQFTNLDAELCEQFPTLAIATIFAFDCCIHVIISLSSYHVE